MSSKFGGWFSRMPVLSRLIKDDDLEPEPVLKTKRPKKNSPQGDGRR